MGAMTSLTVPVHMRFGDIDSYGHANNVIQLQYLEDARVRLSETPIHGIDGVPDGTTFRQLTGARLTVVGRQEVEYTAQLHYRLQPVQVRIWVSNIGATSYVLNYHLQDQDGDQGQDGGTIFAMAQSTTVQIGRESGRPERLSPEQIAFLNAYSGEPVHFRRRPEHPQAG